MGGYDFPGGNSGIDMFALTGWIPEQFRTDAADFNAQRLWERSNAHLRLEPSWWHSTCACTCTCACACTCTCTCTCNKYYGYT